MFQFGILKMLHEKWNFKNFFINYCKMANIGSVLFKFEIIIRKTIRLIEIADEKLINAELA